MTKVTESRELRMLAGLAESTLTETEMMAWTAAVTGHRFMAYLKKTLIIYTFTAQGVTVVRRLKCQGLDVTAQHGFESTWQDEMTGEALEVSHAPKQIAPGIFLGHTIYTSADYVEHQTEQFGMRFSMYFRSRKHPLYSREEGIHYILEEAIFKEQFSGM